MTTVAVSMVRDEADMIGPIVEHMLTQVDAVLVADNLSADDTRPILDRLAEKHAGRLIVVDDLDPAYRQSAKMTGLARRACLDLGADWIVPFDADEYWYSPFGRIADVLADVAAQWLIVPARLYDHVPTALDSPLESNPVRRLGWRRRIPLPLPKVACRWRADLVIAPGNHGAHYDGGGTTFDELLTIRHFPHRSVDQLVRKIRNGNAAYLAAGDSLAPELGAHWRQWGALLEAKGETAIADLFHAWYWREVPNRPIRVDGEILPALIFDPAP